MTAYGKETEIEGFKRLIKTFPTGILSLVSDSYDFWKVHTETIYELREEILRRDGKLVFRGDSGDPVDIICGTGNKYRELKYFPEGEVLPEYFEDYLLDEVSENTPHGEHGVVEYEQTYIIRGEIYKAKIHNISWNRHDKQYYYIDMYEKADITVEKVEQTPEHKGAVELLWDCFGGTVNDQGYKVLNPKVGAIYGDGINFERATQICERLKAKGFASTNIVFGWGSWSMGMCSRDSQGCAVKATYIEKQSENDIEGIEIFKEPKTDHGKNSAKGLLRVIKDCEEGEYKLEQQCTWDDVESEDNQLKIIFKNGQFIKRVNLQDIRNNLNLFLMSLLIK